VNPPSRRELGRAYDFLRRGDTPSSLLCLRRLASHERWLGARLRLAREVRRTQLDLDLPPLPAYPGGASTGPVPRGPKAGADERDTPRDSGPNTFGSVGHRRRKW